MSTRIDRIDLSLALLPLATPVSDAKVLTGRQKPLSEVAILFAEVFASDGATGTGFSYSKRAGGRGQYAHALEVAPAALGADTNDIGALWLRLAWAGASVGRSGLATQAIAAIDIALWDMKASRAGLPLAKLLGAYRDAVPCYNTSGGFLNASVDEITARADQSISAGIGGIKIKVGHPSLAYDLARLEAIRAHVGDRAALMVDANQQWDHRTALRAGRAMEPMGLVWIEEPLDAYDAAGHAALAAALDTPIASGEMLTSPAEHRALLDIGAVDVAQPDAARVGGITPFLKIMGEAERRHLVLAPHFAMETHIHLAAAYPHGAWVEHFDWLEPLFEHRMRIADGCMVVPDRPGLGLTLTERARELTVARETIR